MIECMIDGTQSSFDNMTHEIKWRLKGNQIFANQEIVKSREKIAIDTKKICIGNEKIWIWVAVDLSDETVIAVYTSCVKNDATTYSFLRNISSLCKGQLPRIFANGENWYPRAFEKLGFRYAAVAFGPGSATERFLSIIDDSISRYLETVTNENTPVNRLVLMESFAGLTNYWNIRCMDGGSNNTRICLKNLTLPGLPGFHMAEAKSIV
ncbi:MAG: hypothetical protein FIB08_06360 [Candidatus Methanoperedens sp.]|nr:hypothetical protein [Candidatus Methanoperedens sp.]